MCVSRLAFRTHYFFAPPLLCPHIYTPSAPCHQSTKNRGAAAPEAAPAAARAATLLATPVTPAQVGVWVCLCVQSQKPIAMYLLWSYTSAVSLSCCATCDSPCLQLTASATFPRCSFCCVPFVSQSHSLLSHQQRMAAYTPVSDVAPRQLLATPGSAGHSSWTASPTTRCVCAECV